MGISFRQIVLVHRFLSKTTLPSTILAVASTLLIAFCVSTFLFRKWRERSIVREDETGVVDVQLRPVTQVWPPDDYKGPIDFDVVFFHGFQFGQDAHNMWKTTWSTRNRPETCWPQEWLGPQLGNNVRILLLSYDAYATKSKSHEFGNTEDVSDIAKNLVQNVVISSQWKLGQEHPFVLVGHSFGGIVIESLVIEIHKISQQHSSNLEKRDVEKANVFLKNMAGVAFYAVPHVGSRQLIEYICRQCEINLPSKQLAQVNKAIILENIDPSISKAADLSNDFFNTLASCTNVYGVIDFIETKPIDDNVGMIVEYRPAQISGHRCYRVEGCDHFSVCKPLDQNHPSYNMLVRFLEGCQKDFLLKPASLPTLPKLVIGRDEAIANVKGKIVDNHMLAVVGMGGIGKTTLEITPVHDLNPKCTSTNPELVVIFFHGIGYGENDDWKETWTSTTSEGKRVCWPQEWLPADLATQNVNNVRILSLSYDSALLGANEHVTDIGKNLVESLVSKSEYEPLWEAPIVLVGYSFGGLVVKSLIVEADKRAKARIVNLLDVGAQRSCAKFLENLKGTIFYGVPHTGGGADFKQYFVYQTQRLNDAKGEEFSKSGILKNIEGFNKQMEDLSVDFENAADPALIIYAFGEGKPVERGESVLVPYASAQQLARRNHYKVEDATHVTICQPTSQQAINYSRLKDVLLTIMKGVQTQPTFQMKHIWMGGKGGSVCTKSEEYDKPVVGEIEAHGIKDAHCKEPTVGESETPESMFGKLETNEMPAGGETGTHESISGELETHEMPTCAEIQSPRFMFAKLDTHQTPTVAEIETLGMDFQVYQHASESLIAFGWRLSLEDNALEFFFPSAHSMSRIVGVGLEFAKVVVSTSNLNVKIVGIGKTSWKNVWSNFTTLDKKLEVISLDGVTGAGSHNNSSNEYLTGEESASKYGVGLCSGNTVHVQFTDAPHESDYCLVLHNLVEYLMLKKVDLSKIGVQCTQDGGAGSSSQGGNNSDQANNNATSLIGQGLSSISYLLKGKWKSNTGDDEDDLSPSKKAQKVEHDSSKKNICKITVLPGPGGSFLSKEGRRLEEAPNGLDDASVDPMLEFEFDKNGKIGKQIYVRTTTTFDLGNAAPTRKVKNSFGWYHDNLKTTLRNRQRLANPQHLVNPQRLAKLDSSDLLMGNPKDTKSSVRRTQTHSDNDESEVGAELQVGYQGTHLKGSFRKKGTKGVTSAREEANENCTSSDVWRGFIYQDLRSTKKSSACWKFTCNLPSPLPLEVLTDDNEWKKYLGSGMCGALQPIFDTKWSIQEEDNTENSVYEFEAERTLNMLSTINEGREWECLEIIQKYGLRMFVNHAMNQLSNVKDNHILEEWGSLSDVMTVGFVTVLTSGSG